MSRNADFRQSQYVGRLGVESLFSEVENERPYEPLNMTTVKWGEVEIERVPIESLVASQYEVSSRRIKDSLEHGPGRNIEFGGDAYPLVVIWQGKTYLVDGHHRVAAEIVKGAQSIDARVLRK